MRLRNSLCDGFENKAEITDGDKQLLSRAGLSDDTISSLSKYNGEVYDIDNFYEPLTGAMVARFIRYPGEQTPYQVQVYQKFTAAIPFTADDFPIPPCLESL